MDGRLKIFETLPRLVKWDEVCLDLKRNGYGARRIGLCIGVTHTTVLMWANQNSEPSWHLGTRLLHLWSVVVYKAAPNPQLITL